MLADGYQPAGHAISHFTHLITRRDAWSRRRDFAG
jgi:hypothetical protein